MVFMFQITYNECNAEQLFIENAVKLEDSVGDTLNSLANKRSELRPKNSRAATAEKS